MPERIYQREMVVVRVKLTALDCASCGVVYGLNEDLEERRRDDGGTFYCPNGHSQVFAGGDKERIRQLEAEVTREKQRLMMAQQDVTRAREQRDTAQRQAAAARGQVTRIKNRASAGVCVHCNRHFENVERHVKSKHPAESPSHADPKP